jgi:hypothetical protein
MKATNKLGEPDRTRACDRQDERRAAGLRIGSLDIGTIWMSKSLRPEETRRRYSYVTLLNRHEKMVQCCLIVIVVFSVISVFPSAAIASNPGDEDETPSSPAFVNGEYRISLETLLTEESTFNQTIVDDVIEHDSETLTKAPPRYSLKLRYNLTDSLQMDLTKEFGPTHTILEDRADYDKETTRQQDSYRVTLRHRARSGGDEICLHVGQRSSETTRRHYDYSPTWNLDSSIYIDEYERTEMSIEFIPGDYGFGAKLEFISAEQSHQYQHDYKEDYWLGVETEVDKDRQATREVRVIFTYEGVL